MVMNGEVAWFEIGVGDTEKGRAFYEGLFGWKFEPGPNEGGYMIGAPNVPGGMHGGDPGGRPYLFFEVDDIQAAIQRVRELGGDAEDADVEGDDESQARYGRFVICHDDQGSYFGLHSPPRNA
jgi:predicted enzyme related to lactoylglutathione lyase